MTKLEESIETPPRPPTPTHNFGTLAVHVGSPHDPVTGAVIAPVSSQRIYHIYVSLCAKELVRYRYRPHSSKLE